MAAFSDFRTVRRAPGRGHRPDVPDPFLLWFQLLCFHLLTDPLPADFVAVGPLGMTPDLL